MSDAMSQAASWKAEKLEHAEAKYGALSEEELSAEWERLSATLKILEGMKAQIEAQIGPLGRARGLVEALLYDRNERARWARVKT